MMTRGLLLLKPQEPSVVGVKASSRQVSSSDSAPACSLKMELTTWSSLSSVSAARRCTNRGDISPVTVSSLPLLFSRGKGMFTLGLVTNYKVVLHSRLVKGI